MDDSLYINIYNYFDYREYLQDIFDIYKKNQKGFSYRSFAKDSGIKSQTYMMRIIKGERHLSQNYIPNICAFFKLNPQEEKYFKVLVAFINTKDPNEKENHLKQILALRYSKDECRIEDKKLNFFKRWYYPIIREIVTIVDFNDDYNFLARLCKPRITSVQAQGAVNYLLQNDFIKKGPDGSYSQTDQIITTGAEVNSTILRKYYRKIMSHFMDSIDTEKREDRDISSLTLSVSENLFRHIKKEIQDFRKKLLTMAKDDEENPERVCLVGMQVIPRTKRIKNNNNED